MDKRRFKFVIPTMVAVAIGAIYMLVSDHNDVPLLNKVLIVIGAALLSGVLAYFLFPTNDEQPPDEKKPYNK